MPEATLFEKMERDLDALTGAGLRRRRRTVEARSSARYTVDGRQTINFASNDYLGLADHPAIAEAAIRGARRWGVGSGASHLVSGHFAVHEALERRLAAFVGCAASLLFSTGYMVNSGVIPALVGRGDAIFADRLIHASLVDGALLSRADLRRYPHGDLAALEKALATSRAPRKLIVTDSVFSMDGDIAPLPELLALAERFDAWLVVDDAHGFGVLGPQGRGACAAARLASERIVYIGTLGKAAGVSGAFVAGSARLIEWLLQKTRSYIFTTGSAPLLAEALLAALDLIEAGDARRATLARHVQALRAAKIACAELLPSTTAIQPLILGENQRASACAEQLLESGLWVPAIRPPTVPEGSSRLRISLSAGHTQEEVAQLIGALQTLKV